MVVVGVAAAWSDWVVEGEIGSREEEAAVLSCLGRWSYALPTPSWRNWKEERERDEERILTIIQAPLP